MLVVVFALTACGSHSDWENPGHPAVDQINESMAAAIANNKKGNQQNNAISKDVANALMPGLELQSSEEEPLARFDVAVDNMPANTFFMGLVKDTPYNIVVDPKIKGHISLNLKQVTIPEVLEALEQAYGFEYHIEKFGIYITKGGLQTRTFKIHYLDIHRKGRSTTVISSGQPTAQTNHGNDGLSGPVAAAVTGNNGSSGSSGDSTVSRVETTTESDFWKILAATVTSIVGVESESVSSTEEQINGAESNNNDNSDSDQNNKSKSISVGPVTFTKSNVSSVIVNPAASLVVVTATPKVLHSVAEYLDEVQSAMTKQVMIEAKILEVNLSKTYQAGIDWSILGMSQSGTQNIVSNDNLPSFQNMFTLNITDGDLFSTTIELLSTQGNVQVLSSPRISTLNNQKALIKVGQDEYFVTDISNTITGTSTTTENTQNVEITPFFSGIALDVTPEISSSDQVLLHIHPVISRVSNHTLTYTVNDSEQSLPSALSTIKETDNIVRARSGQVVVIGGLMENKTSEYLGSTPYADSIPFVGSLFRKTNQLSSNNELVILLKPIIVDNGTWTSELESISERFKKLKRGYHFGAHQDRFGNTAEFENGRNYQNYDS